MKLASGIAPVSRLIAAGMTVGLGTDGCASNNNLDMLLEMDTAAKLQKIAVMDPTALDAVTVLKMATMRRRKSAGFWGYHRVSRTRQKSRYHHCGYPKTASDPPVQPVFPSGVFSRRGRCQPLDHQRQAGHGRPALLTLDLEDILSRATEKAALVNQWISGDENRPEFGPYF